VSAPDEPTPVVHAVVAVRSMSVEIRSAVAWMTWCVATVAWAFGFVNGRAACASLLAATLIGMSTLQPKPRKHS
jgi:hypothetical protein